MTLTGTIKPLPGTIKPLVELIHVKRQKEPRTTHIPAVYSTHIPTVNFYFNSFSFEKCHKCLYHFSRGAVAPKLGGALLALGHS